MPSAYLDVKVGQPPRVQKVEPARAVERHGPAAAQEGVAEVSTHPAQPRPARTSSNELLLLRVMHAKLFVVPITKAGQGSSEPSGLHHSSGLRIPPAGQQLCQQLCAPVPPGEDPLAGAVEVVQPGVQVPPLHQLSEYDPLVCTLGSSGAHCELQGCGDPCN